MSERHFHIVKPKTDEPEHKAICSIDGESWPCQHARVQSHQMLVARVTVRCLGCGQLCNAWASLTIEESMDGRTIYFHARKHCLVKARQWWDDNVRPHTGEAFREGQWIGSLSRYIGVRCEMAKVGQGQG